LARAADVLESEDDIEDVFLSAIAIISSNKEYFSLTHCINSSTHKQQAWSQDTMLSRRHIASEVAFLQQCLPVALELTKVHGWTYPKAITKLHRASWHMGVSPTKFAQSGFSWIPQANWPEFVSFEEAAAFQKQHISPEDMIKQGDKAALKMHLEFFGVNTPPITALIARTKGSDVINVPIITHETECRAHILKWLSKTSELLIKPCYGTRGQDVWAISNGQCLDGEGAVVSLDVLIEALFRDKSPSAQYGYLAQPLLRAHDVFRRINGSDRLCTARLYTISAQDRVSVFGSEMKFPRGGRLTDNWRDGRRGNLVGPVCMADGRIEAPWSGVSPKLRYGLERLTHHPDTGIAFDSINIPFWSEILEVGAKVAKSFPNTAMLGLDIAVTNEGVFVIDANNQTSTEWLGGNRGMRPYLADFYPDVFGRAMRRA
jgi:Sugar-transfer associated ATP-grasp